MILFFSSLETSSLELPENSWVAFLCAFYSWLTLLSCSTISHWIPVEESWCVRSPIRRPLLSSGHQRCSLWWQRSLGGTAETCAAQVGCCSLAVLEHVTCGDLAGTHWPVTLAHPSAATPQPSWERGRALSIQRRVLVGLEVCGQRLLIFNISLWLCIPLSNPCYLNETVFLESLFCWEETSCCGLWSDTILRCLNPEKH